MSDRAYGFGWKKDKLDPRDMVFGITHTPSKLPGFVSLRDQMPPVYDQGNLGSCTGNGIAAIMQYAEIQGYDKAGKLVPSRLFIYYHERELEDTIDEDDGAEIRDGLKVVAHRGVPPETYWPYDISKFADKPPERAEHEAGKHEAIQYASVVPGAGAPMRAAMAAGYPVVFGFSVPESFESLSTNDPVLNLPKPNEQFVGGHCVVAVGYDFTRHQFPMNVVECRNSWGDSWGEAGHFYMDAAYFNNRNLTSDFWVVKKAS
jgi:C1A family cysteine protease